MFFTHSSLVAESNCISSNTCFNVCRYFFYIQVRQVIKSIVVQLLNGTDHILYTVTYIWW